MSQVTLPPGVTGGIGPDFSPIGSVYWYTVKSTNPGYLMELKSLQDRVIAKYIRSVPDVVDDSSFGGITREYQIRVDPDKLISITAPSFNPLLAEFAAKRNVTFIPGALTPTEVVNAWAAGADFVKVFPCGPVGGDRYIKSLHTSLPQVPLIAAGGVNQQTAGSFILSGATAIGVGAELIPTEAIQRRQAQRIHELARRFLKNVRDARQQIEEWKRTLVVTKFSPAEKCAPTNE